MKVFIRIIFCFVLLVSVLGPSHAMGQLFMFENPLVGEKAPDFTLKTADGKEVNLTEFIGGQSTIIFFWATWCPHCREQLEHLTASQGQEIEKKGIKILLVDIGEKAEEVLSYVKKYNVSYDVALDEQETVAGKYNLVGVPTFFFVDKDGIVRGVEHAIPENYEKVFNSKK